MSPFLVLAIVSRVTGDAELISGRPRSRRYFRIADNPGAISFCLNLEFHAKIAE